MSDQLWSKSDSIGKLAEALAKAQAKFDPVLKDSANPAFHSKYADLATVIGATQPHLSAEGLSVIQMPHANFGPDDAKMITLTTMLVHSSGEWIASDLSLPAMMRERFDSQSVGSAITYARRYALSAVVGVAQEDDDGNKSAGVGTKADAQAVAKEKIKEAAARGNKTAQDALSQEVKSNKIILRRPEKFSGHYFTVEGFLEAKEVQSFLADTSADKFKRMPEGIPYWRLPINLEKDFCKLCENLHIEIEG